MGRFLCSKQLRTYLESESITYLSRIEETYLFYEVVKNITEQPVRSNFFQSHYYLPLISYLENIDINHKPVALLFNYWETKDWVINNSKRQTNLKGSFCWCVYKQKINLNIFHLVPRKKVGGVDVFSNRDLFEFGYGSILDIREDMKQKSKATAYNDFAEDPFGGDFENWSRSVIEDEWRGMNEESDGAAYWNID